MSFGVSRPVYGWYVFRAGGFSVVCDRWGGRVVFRGVSAFQEPGRKWDSVPAWWFDSLASGEREDLFMAILEKRGGDKDAKGKPKASVDQAFKKDFPFLWEYLSAPTYKDGSARETATLTIFCDGGVWSAALTDRDQDETCWAGAPEFGALLKLLEERCQDPSAWRKRKPYKGRGGKG